MNDDLDALDDAKLSEVFAVEVAGWKYHQSKHGHFFVTDPDGNTTEPDFGGPSYDSISGAKLERHWTDRLDLPSFATDANAVLPWLEKQGRFDVMYREASGYDVVTKYVSGQANRQTTFARAACIALIRAHRAQTP